MGLAFKPHFRVEVVEPDGVFVLGEHTQQLLNGPVYRRLAPLLDGSATADEIVDLLADEVDPAEVHYALATLDHRGLLTNGEGGVEFAFWEALGSPATAAANALSSASVEVVASTDALAVRFSDILGSLGIQRRGAANLKVVVAEHYLWPELQQINRRALASDLPWMLVKPFGTVAWIGPLFRPGETGCWECLAQRLRSHRRVESYVERRKALGRVIAPAAPALPSTIEAVLQLAATQIGLQVAGHGSPATGAVLSLDVKTMQTERHILVRRPQCPDCGTALSAREVSPIRLTRRAKGFAEEGRHAVVPPAETLANHGHHISAITGIVAGLHVLHGESALPHVYLAGHNFAFPAHDLRSLRRGLRSLSSGKGVSQTQARASALCEALERYSGILQGDEPHITASYRSLSTAAVDPAQCLLFSARQYAQRDVWNARDSQFSRVPAPFDPAARLDWVPVWSLTQNAPQYMLLAYCYFGHRPKSGTTSSCWADSNGCAAGNTIEEAILQGFLELVERDAVSIWWYNRLRRPGIDLGSFATPYLAALQHSYAQAGRRLWALDLTSDLGIPVVAAVSRRTDGPREQILFGFGAHLDPTAALVRAASELNQLLARATSGGADRDDDDFGDEDFRSWWRTASLDAQPYLAPDSSRPQRQRRHFENLASDDILDDILRCRQIVESRGMQVLVLDQTRADIGLPVARVIVPGLRHFWPRFAPGRLYDVPVITGERPDPHTEADLNPIPMFI